MNRDSQKSVNDFYENDFVTKGTNGKWTTDSQSELTGSDGVKTSGSRAVVVCLVLLCVLLLTTVIVLCVHIFMKSTNDTQEKQQLLTKITNLTEERDGLLTNSVNVTKERDRLLTSNLNLAKERDGLLTNNVNLAKERDGLLTNNVNLAKERDGLLTNNVNLAKERDGLLTNNVNLAKERDQLRLFFADGWKYHQSNLYFLSSEKKNWAESRRYCTDRGADLIIINNREEQDFVQNISGGDLVWIGLNDIDQEGSWKWVDGSSGTSGFWQSGQPNSYGGADEDCALNHSQGWGDWPCDLSFKWICENRNFK